MMTSMQEMDSDGDLRLSAEEVAAGLRQLGHAFATEDIQFMFSKACVQHG